MTRPTLNDIAPRFRDQVAAQLASVSHPRTVRIEVADAQIQPAKRPKGYYNDYGDVCRWAESAKLPKPTPEHRFHSERRWRFDYAWPELRVAVETEGGVWTMGRHTRGAGFLKDLEKYSEAAAMGWLVIRVEPKDLRTARTADWVRRAMAEQQHKAI